MVRLRSPALKVILGCTAFVQSQSMQHFLKSSSNPAKFSVYFLGLPYTSICNVLSSRFLNLYIWKLRSSTSARSRGFPELSKSFGRLKVYGAGFMASWKFPAVQKRLS